MKSENLSRTDPNTDTHFVLKLHTESKDGTNAMWMDTPDTQARTAAVKINNGLILMKPVTRQYHEPVWHRVTFKKDWRNVIGHRLYRVR